MLQNLLFWREPAKLLAEASALEDEFGPEHAIERLRDRIAEADRKDRKRLYRLHDEIVRRHGAARLGLSRPES